MRSKPLMLGLILVISLLFISGGSTTAASPSLLISEVAYDGEGLEADSEFVELYNPTTSSIDLTGWTIADNYASFDLSGSIGAGEFFVIADDGAGFQSTYGVSADLTGSTLALSNSGDEVILSQGTTQIDYVAWEGYTSGWTVSASTGNSLHRTSTTDSDTDSDFVTEGTNPGTSNYLSGSTEPDTTPPTISITNPTDGETVGGSISISTSSSDDRGVDYVEIYIDGSLAATASSFYWDTTTVSDGSHTITATAYDAAGNSASDSISVTVDNANYEPPAVGELKIMTYNIEASGANADWKTVVQEENADIILFIETGNWDDNNNELLDQYCQELSDWSLSVGEDPYNCVGTTDVPYSTSGEAVFSRLPIVESVQIPIVTLDDGSTHDVSHDFLDVTIDIGGINTHFVAAHLKCCGGDQLNYDKRIMQQEGIINYMDDLGDVPLVYAGDLNSFSPEDGNNNMGDLEWHPMSMMLEDTTYHDMTSSYSTIHTWDDPLTTLYPGQFFPTYGHQNTRYTSRIDFITANQHFNPSYYVDATVGDTPTADTGSDHYSTDFTYNFDGSGGDDTTAPSQVTGLSATTISSSQIDLTWDAATDDTGVDHYNVYRDGVLVDQPTTTSYSDTGLAASTTYTYEVSAVDAAGNEGTLSSSVSATTDSSSDTTPPAQVTGLTATSVSSSQIDLTWDTNSESDLDHYNVYRDGVLVAQPTTSSYSDTGLTADTTYTYEVSAVDTSGNEGSLSSSASATTDSGTTTDTMYVSDVTATVARQYGPWTDVEVSVTVLDSSGNPVSGATVTIDVDGASYTGTTDSNGNVVIYIDKAIRGSGSLTATVVDVSASGYTYDSASNVETSDSVTV